MSEIDYAELRKLAENATPGPWAADEVFQLTAPTQIDGFSNPEGRAAAQRQTEHDWAFIAAMDPPTVIALLDRIEVLRSVVIGDWESEYAAQWVKTDGLPVTDIGADREDIAALVESQDGWAREVHRFVGPWVPVPEQNPEPTDQEAGRG